MNLLRHYLAKRAHDRKQREFQRRKDAARAAHQPIRDIQQAQREYVHGILSGGR